MSEIRFRSAAHHDFFLENMMKFRVNDCYHQAFFYVMGIASETRANIKQMFDFKNDCIVPEGTQRKARNTISHQRNCFAANLPCTLWRISR